MPAAAAAAFHEKFCDKSRVHVKYSFNSEFENKENHFEIGINMIKTEVIENMHIMCFSRTVCYFLVKLI